MSSLIEISDSLQFQKEAMILAVVVAKCSTIKCKKTFNSSLCKTVMKQLLYKVRSLYLPRSTRSRLLWARRLIHCKRWWRSKKMTWKQRCKNLFKLPKIQRPRDWRQLKKSEISRKDMKDRRKSSLTLNGNTSVEHCIGETPWNSWKNLVPISPI